MFIIKIIILLINYIFFAGGKNGIDFFIFFYYFAKRIFHENAMDDTANKFDFMNSTGGIFFSKFHWWNLIFRIPLVEFNNIHTVIKIVFAGSMSPTM